MQNEYLIRIILRARDEVSATLRRVRQEVDDFNNNMRGGRDDTNGLTEAINSLRSSVDSLRQRLGRAGEALDSVRTKTRQARDETDSYSEATDRASEATIRQARSSREAGVATSELAKATRVAKDENVDLSGSLRELQGRYQAYMRDVRNQKHETVEAAAAVGQFRAEFEKLFRAADSGSELEAEIGRAARRARESENRLKSIEEARRQRLRDDIVEARRIEEERLQDAEYARQREVAEEEAAAIQRRDAGRWLTAEVQREEARRAQEVTDSARAAAQAVADIEIAEAARSEADRHAMQLRHHEEAEKAEAESAKRRIAILRDLRDAADKDSAERERFERELADAEIAEAARVEAARHTLAQQREEAERKAAEARQREVEAEDNAARAAWARDLRYAREKEAQERREQVAQDRLDRAEERSQNRRLGFVQELLDAVEGMYTERERFERELAEFEVNERARVEAARAGSRLQRDVAAARASGTAVPEVDTSEVDRKMAVLDSRLDRWARKRVVATADADIRDAQTNIALIEAEMLALGRKRVDIQVRVHESLNNARSVMSGLRQEAEASESVWARLGRHFENNHIQVSQFSSALRGIVIFAAIAFAQQLLSTLTALVGSLISVASSAIQAGAALGGAFAAGAAQAIPAVGLLVAAFSRVSAVNDAMKQADLVRQQQAAQGEARDRRQAGATDQLANAQDGLASALDGVGAAQRRVADAQRNFLRAQERELDALRELNVARREGRRELEDLAFAARGAALSQEEAEDALRRAIATGQTADIASRELAVDEGGVRASRARVDNTRAQARGVEGTDRVQNARDAVASARESVADARRGIADAQRGLENAQRGVERARRSIDQARRSASGAAEDQIASVGKLNYLLEQLSPAELRLYESFKRIRKSYEENVRPITDLMVDSFARAVDRVDGILNDADFMRDLRGLSASLADEIDKSMEAATSGDNMRQYRFFIRESTDNTKTLGDITRNSFGILLDIAEAAAPALRRILDGIKDITEGWEDFTSSADGQDKMRDFFLRGEEHLRSWGRLLKATLGLFGALIGASEESGQTIVDDLTAKIQDATRWIEEHQTEVQRFFEDAREATYDIASVVWDLGKAIIEVFDKDRVEGFANFLKEVFIPTLVNLVEWFGRVTGAVMAVLSLPFISDFVRFAAEILIIHRVFKTLIAIIGIFQLSIKAVLVDLRLLSGAAAITAGSAGLGGLAGSVKGLGSAFLALAKGQGIKAAIDAFKAVRSNAAAARAAAAAAATAGATSGLVDSRGNPIPASGNPAGDGTNNTRTRRQRVMRGVGIGAVVAGGAVALGQGPSSARDYANQGDWSQALDNVSGSIQRLASLDIGGFFSSLGGWSNNAQKDLKDFANTADASFKKATEGRNEKALRDMADNARKMAEKFPLAADSLNAFADKADQAADDASRLNERLKTLDGNLKDNFGKDKLNANDLIDPMAYRQVTANMRRMARDGATSMSDLRENLKYNLTQINNAFEQGTPSWRKLMEDNFANGIRSVRVSMRNGTISVKDGMRQIREITRDQMRYARDNMDSLSHQGKERLSSNFTDAAEAIKIQMNRGKISTREGMREIRKLMRENMKLYGFTEEQARMHEKGVDPVSGKPYAALGGKAVGGWLGNPGERGQDGTAGFLYGHPVGRGEAVLNWAHQKYVDNALKSQYGHGINDMFDRVKGEHAGSLPGGYARGKRGGIVSVPGFPGERAASYILDEISQVVRRFGLRLTDAFGPGHKSPGHTVRGDAADFAGPDRSMDRAVRWLVSKGYVVGYDGRFGSKAWSGHGPSTVAGDNAHLHVEFGQKDAGAGGALGDATQIPFRRIRGFRRGSELGNIAQGAVERVRGAANERLAALVAQGGIAQEGIEAKTGEGRLSLGEVRNYINRAMIEVGVPMQLRSAWRAMSIRRARQESGFDPEAVNNWDSNAAAGDPSKGLFQTIGATFRAYMLPGMNNILNPLHNTIAAFRYMVARYGRGNWSRALSGMLGREGVGYRFGGAVPGYGGGDQHNAKLEGGEHVLTKEEVRNAGGHEVIRALRKMLGGGAQAVGNKLREGGAFIGHTPRQVIGNITDTNSYADTTPAGILRQIQELRAYIPRLKTTGENYGFALRELARLAEALTGATSTAVARARARLARSRFQVGPNGVVIRMRDDDQQREAESTADAGERRRISRRVASDRSQLSSVERRMRGQRPGLMSEREEDALKRELQQLEKGDENQAEKNRIKKINEQLETGKRRNRAYNRLVGERNRLLTSISEGDEAVADYLEAEYNRQRERIESMTSEANENAQRREGGLDLRERIGDLLGRVDMVSDIPQKRIDSVNTQIADLTAAASEADRTGNADLAQQIRDQIDELQNKVTEITVGQFESGIEQINSAAQRRLGRLDVAGRMLDALGVVGQAGARMVGGEAFSRAGVFQQRGDTLTKQRDALAGQLDRAVQIYGENSTKVQDLRDQIVELDVTIAENTRAAFQARVEELNTNTEYATSINGLRQRIVQLNGEISGQVDSTKILALAQEEGNNLQRQRVGLEGLLNDARAAGDEQAVRDLERALLENEVAILENTKTVKELDGTLGKTQSFSTTAWQTFRQAIFNGSGGLLPQYQIPGMDVGGKILSDGLIYGHAGETIKPALVKTPYGGDITNGGDHIDIDIHAVEGKVDAGYIAKRIMFEKSSAR